MTAGKGLRGRSRGFTLVELIVVIVILGILAVTAAPKFMNLQGDAKRASLEGVAGAMRGAASMIYGKSLIAGKTSATSGWICMSGSAATSCTGSESDAVKIRLGYPDASADGIIRAVDIDAVAAGSSDADSHDFVYRVKTWESGLRQILVGFDASSVPDSYQDSAASSGSYNDKCFLFYDTPSISGVDGVDSTSGPRILIFSGGC